MIQNAPIAHHTPIAHNASITHHTPIVHNTPNAHHIPNVQYASGSHVALFTVEEENLIAMYPGDTPTDAITQITTVRPYMDDEMKTIADTSVHKLALLTAQEYNATSFVLTCGDDDEEPA